MLPIGHLHRKRDHRVPARSDNRSRCRSSHPRPVQRDPPGRRSHRCVAAKHQLREPTGFPACGGDHVGGKPAARLGRLAGVRSVRKAPRALDEERLVRLVARGDRAAFEELYRRTAPWMALRLRRRCADEQIVAEVMQETYLAVWRAAGAFAGSSTGGTAAGWLWTIAARRLVDAFRRRAHHAEPPHGRRSPRRGARRRGGGTRGDRRR